MQSPTTSTRFTVLLPPAAGAWHDVVTRLLEPQGVQTLVGRSGRDMLSVLEATTVHAVVLDTQMPQLGGMQVLKFMREMKKAPPAILLAEQMTNHLLREALTMHVFSVLTKPVDFNLLLDALARLIKRFHENRWPGESGN
ncbi:MAG: response regulator [Tepidisphaeraceae bacterium]|jgi:DNA-binding NtrC family response regulator